MPEYQITLHVRLDHEHELTWLLAELHDAVERRGAEVRVPVPVEATPGLRVVQGEGKDDR